MRSVKYLTSAVLAIGMFAAAAFAQNNVTITSATGAPGSQVSVEINAASDTAIYGADVTLSFDQNVLQLLPLSENGIALGSDADSLTFADLGESKITEANSNGSIIISMILSGNSGIPAGSSLNLIDIKFMIAEGASDGDMDLTLSNVALSNDSGFDINLASTTDGTVTVSSAMAEGNRIWVEDATGSTGGTANITVKLTSDTDVHALSFDLLFDQTALQIRPLSSNGVVAGDDASGLDPPILDDDLISAANSSGRLEIYMIHLNLDPENPDLNSVSAGMDRQVLKVKLAVDSLASVGDMTIGLENVELANWVQDTTVQAIEVTAESGTLSINEFAKGDASGDGKVDIFDVLAVLSALKGTPTVGPSDIDGDGDTDIFDVLELLKLL